MALFREFTAMIAAAFSVDGYYKALNRALKRFGGEYTMLHYPYFIRENESFLQGQKNLTDHCLDYAGSLKGKNVLEIGCGNGIQAMYVLETRKPALIDGIDLNHANIEIANSEKEARGLENIRFAVDDSQKLETIGDKSKQLIYSIESAFHYPDKEAFLRQAYRCLEPGGSFLLADLIANHKKSRGIRKAWKKKLVLHHWTIKEYTEAMERTGFTSVIMEDITASVIRGFLSYPAWFREMHRKNRLNDGMFKLFYLINLKWYLYLLRKRRHYMVFYAQKPA